MIVERQTDGEQPEGVRVHVYLSRLGYGSRREIESHISEGKVQINLKPAKLGQKINPEVDQIKYRGKLVPKSQAAKPFALILHKPRLVITSVKDPDGRLTVMDLIPKNLRVYPVGRLDFQSEGLVLMANDGELAHRLTHPKFEISKVYEVKVRGRVDEKKLQALKRGVRVDGQKTKPAEILEVEEVTQDGVPKHRIVIKVYEGRKHLVRMMFEAVGCRVTRLKRIGFGPLTLKGIPRGGYRILSKPQLDRLRREIFKETKEIA